MKKILFSLGAILFGAIILTARPVNQDRAMSAAAQALGIKGTKALTSELSLAWNGESRSAGVTLNSVSDPTMWVFNRKGGGYIVISGDDAISPIFAFSASGSFNPDDMVPPQKAWYDALRHMVNTSRQQGRKQSREIAYEWENLPLCNGGGGTQVVLETPQWHQQAPFHNNTPLWKGQHCLVGCVATAASILMAYHQWPDHPAAVAIDAYTTTNGNYIDVPGETAETMAARDYHFASLPKVGSPYANDFTNQSAEIQDYLATLCYDVGRSFKMNYDTGFSGAFGEQSIKILAERFKYKKSASMKYFDMYDFDTYMGFIKTDIDAHRPILFSGESAAGGHQFMIDGYDLSNGTVHFNWGWGQSYNQTWYRIFQNGEGFFYRLIGIFNIEPWKEGSQGEYITSDLGIYGPGVNGGDITRGGLSTTDDLEPDATVKINLTGLCVIGAEPITDYKLRVYLFAKDGTEKNPVGNEFSFGTLSVQPVLSSAWSNVTLPSTLNFGDYIAFKYKIGEGEWKVLRSISSNAVVDKLPIYDCPFIHTESSYTAGGRFACSIDNYAYPSKGKDNADNYAAEWYIKDSNGNVMSSAFNGEQYMILPSTPGKYLVEVDLKYVTGGYYTGAIFTEITVN